MQSCRQAPQLQLCTAMQQECAGAACSEVSSRGTAAPQETAAALPCQPCTSQPCRRTTESAAPPSSGPACSCGIVAPPAAAAYLGGNGCGHNTASRAGPVAAALAPPRALLALPVGCQVEQHSLAAPGMATAMHAHYLFLCCFQDGSRAGAVPSGYHPRSPAAARPLSPCWARHRQAVATAWGQLRGVHWRACRQSQSQEQCTAGPAWLPASRHRQATSL